MPIEEKRICNMHTKEKKNQVHVVRSQTTKKTQSSCRMNIMFTLVLHQRRQMNKLFLIVAMFVLVSACSIGKKCTYTQDGTKLSSYVWFYKDKPIDLDKNNCN